MAMWLVTGGAGFIGSHVVEALVERGERVRVLDDLSTGRRENLAAVAGQVDLVVGDVRDLAAVSQAAAGVDVFVHLAAVASVQVSVENPRLALEVNVTGTLNVLEAARSVGARRFVLASSAAVYGDHTALPLKEELAHRPLSPYAMSKAAGEGLCLAYTASYGLPTVALRFFNIYGPRQDPRSPYSGVISIFVERMRQELPPVIFGDGRQTRDFVYVKDLVEAILLAGEREEAVGGVLNIAGGRETTVLQLAATLNQVLGTDLTPTFGPPRSGEVRYSRGDARRAQEKLGWQATTGLLDGLRALVT